MHLSDIKLNFDYTVVRNGEFEVFGLLDSPTDLNILVFTSDLRFIKQFSENVTCVICTPDLISKIPKHIGILTAQNPKKLFFEFHNQLSVLPPLSEASFKTNIGHNSNIHKMAYVAENNVKIGNNVLIEEFVSIKENTVIGDNVIIRAGTVVSGEGFYFIRETDEPILPVRHFGGVIIEDDVEIQQSCCIDRAYFTWDNTIIGKDSKLDNHVHIGHAVKVGMKVFLTSCVSVAGNVIIGDGIYVGPGSTFSNNITAGDHSRVSLGSVVTRNVPESTTVTGNFAIDHSIFMRNLKESIKKK